MIAPATSRNGQAVALATVPLAPWDDFRAAILKPNGRVSALFAWNGPEGRELLAVIADDFQAQLRLIRTPLPGDSFPSLTPELPAVHLFEREIMEETGVVPEGHPWPKPVRFPRATVGEMDYYRVEGKQVHEVAVGPVHAGVIEPGHFRFQCQGEHVMHLEISLGYQHRGVEKALVGGPHRHSMHQMEAVAGDTSIAHAWAFAQNLESLSGTRVSARAHVVRAVGLELERLANHTGDLGALAGDVGYLPTMSYCGRLRGDFLNMSATLCGNRFGRGLVRPGGVLFDLDKPRAEELAERLAATFRDVKEAVELLWEAPSVNARFEGTGIVSEADALALGLVGPPARACGIERDVRRDHPVGIFQFAHIPVAAAPDGDVNSRAFVRWLEIQRSVEFLQERFASVPEGTLQNPLKPLGAAKIAVALIEGWRGEVCHVAITDNESRLAHYKVVDPSFHNWSGLAMALRKQEISDFPLCNKSFNLSYCGFDL